MNRWLPTVAWLGVVVWLTLSPRPIPADLEPPGRLDLLGHLVIFAILAFLAGRAARATQAGPGTREQGWRVAAVLIAFAAADELLQPPLAGRDAAWSDLLANLVGIATGLRAAGRGARPATSRARPAAPP
jgi:VanZ family protein